MQENISDGMKVLWMFLKRFVCNGNIYIPILKIHCKLENYPVKTENP